MSKSVYDVYVFYLEPNDLQGKSHRLTVRIAELEEVYNPRMKRKESRLVLGFNEAKKYLALNKTQARAMVDMAGTDDYTKWPGVKIVLRPATTQNGKATIEIGPAARQQLKGLTHEHRT